MYYQHGDVIIEKVDYDVRGSTKKLNHKILADGEVTGHKHQITEGEIEIYEKDGVLYLYVLSDHAIITHEEHKPIEFEKGNFKIRKVLEYDHFAEEARKVTD